jgi:peptidyl-prolyl cis-trans isomerase SurA
MNIKNLLFFLPFAFLQSSLFSQCDTCPSASNVHDAYIVDQIIGVVGSKMLKQSDLENDLLQYRSRGNMVEDGTKCEIYEQQLQQKLMVNQAMLDSLPVSETQVENELNSRLNGYIAQIGSTDKLEKLYNKSITDIKEDFRKSIRDMMLVQSMQNKIVGDIKITPSEVETFYNKLSKDSLPLINTQVELAQLALYPAYAEKSVLETKEKLLDLRKRILEGQSFRGLAGLYSEDPGSKANGGEVGFETKAELDPEYAKAAFALSKPGEVSRIVESQMGYHIIQLIERRGDKVNTRHILMKPVPDPNAVTKVMQGLDSIAMFLRKDSLKWDQAVAYYSMDEDTRLNKGYLVNPQTGNTKFELENLPAMEYSVVKNMKVGQISSPFESHDKNGKIFYKIITIKSITPAHKANLHDDYYMLQEAAKNQKKVSVLDEWFTEKQQTTFINVFDGFRNCGFRSKGWNKSQM